MLEIEKREPLSKVAARRLRTAIIDGTFALGEPLSELPLAKSLGISKTPLREALAQLQAEGLIKVIPQKGTFVFSLSAEEVAALCELRFTLESAALKYAFDRNHVALLVGLKGIVAKMTRAKEQGDAPVYLQLDNDFHEQFFAHCKNDFLHDAYHHISYRVSALRNFLSKRPYHTDKSFKEHQDIIEAIEEHDLDAGQAVLNRHINRTRKSFAKGMDESLTAE